MPAIIKPARVSVAHQSEPSKNGALTTVSAYVLFDFAEPNRLLTEQALWPMVTEQMPNQAIFDKGQLKPKAELIIAGCALSPTDAPVEGVRVTARFGKFQKQLAVFGDRYWHMTDEGVQISRPVPFEKMPIGDIQAFGGETFEPNRRGKGFGARTLVEAGFNAPLPNVEAFNQLIKSLDDRPEPAHFGPIPADDVTRLRYLGTYDQHWMDHVSPLKPEDFNPLYHCEAPADQRFDTFFEGGDAFSISGMSRGETTVGGELPRLTARCFYAMKDTGDLREAAMRCDTVTLFPNVQKATLAFRGLIPGQDRFAEDVATIMVAIENTDAPRRSGDYYADVYRKRTSDDAHKYALSDYQLMPQIDESVLSAKRQARLDKAAADRQRFMDNQEWALGKLLEDEGLPGDLMPPHDKSMIDELPLIAQPTTEELENGELDLALLLDEVKAVEDALLEKRDQEMVKAELQRRALIAVMPPDRLPPRANTPIADDDLMQKYPDVEMDPEIAETLSQFKDQMSQIQEHALLEKGIDPEQATQETLNNLFGGPEQLTNEDIEDAYQKAAARALRLPEGSLLADLRTAVEEMDLSALEDLPNAVPALPDSSQSVSPDNAADKKTELKALIDQQLEGAENTSLPQDRFSSMLDALMDKADSIDTGMDLETAQSDPGQAAKGTIERVMGQLGEAETMIDDNMAMARQQAPSPLFPLDPLPEGVALRLGTFIADKVRDGHDFKEADLAGADLQGIDFSGQDLSGTYFEQSNLAGARFSGCDLTGAVFTGATLDDADFTGADLSLANLSKVSAKNICLDRAKLHDLMIFQADFSGTSGKQSELDMVRFIESTLDDVRFEHSSLTDCQLLSGSADGFAASGSRLLRTMFVLTSLKALDLSGSDLERVGFMEVSAPRADMRNGNWNSVGFMGACDLTASRFDNLNAAQSAFNMAHMTECCFLRAKGNGCFFNACDLQANDFRLSSFRNSLFGRSDFRRSDFFGANLFMAAMTGVDLTGSSMRAANLYAADFLEAKLAGCDFTGANLGLTLLEQPIHA